MARFAPAFVEGLLARFEKDMAICLTPAKALRGSRPTHAYFPALAACCGFIEYLTGLHRGNLKRIGWQQVAAWAAVFMSQPDYDRETIRILFDAFRNTVAHQGIASGVWVDPNRGVGEGRRITWRLTADARYPGCDVVPEVRELTRDPPWPCSYTHRVHIHLKRLSIDIREAARRYRDRVARDPDLQASFLACMRQLYPE